MILEAVTAEEPSTSTVSVLAESTFESTITIKQEQLSPERVIESFKLFVYLA